MSWADKGKGGGRHERDPDPKPGKSDKKTGRGFPAKAEPKWNEPKGRHAKPGGGRHGKGAK